MPILYHIGYIVYTVCQIYTSTGINSMRFPIFIPDRVCFMLFTVPRHARRLYPFSEQSGSCTGLIDLSPRKNFLQLFLCLDANFGVFLSVLYGGTFFECPGILKTEQQIQTRSASPRAHGEDLSTPSPVIIRARQPGVAMTGMRDHDTSAPNASRHWAAPRDAGILKRICALLPRAV